MNRYIVLTPEATSLIDCLFDLAEKIFPTADFSMVRVSHGLAGYGNNAGNYFREKNIINISTNPTFNNLVLTEEGYDLGPELEGTIIHELCHHAEHWAPPNIPNAGTSTHARGSWLWAICSVWQYLYSDVEMLTPENIVFARARTDENIISVYTSQFDGTRPDNLCSLINCVFQMYKRTCTNCNQPFTAKRIRAGNTFCSNKCRAAYSRLNRDA